MSIYYDSSFLVTLYLPEPLSAKARELVDREGKALLVNRLQELELRNAVRQKAWRGDIDAGTAFACLRIFDDDCIGGRIRRRSLPWDAVFEMAETLSQRLALSSQCRAFDVLHVATAVVSNVTSFATFDASQASLAAAARLEVIVL